MTASVDLPPSSASLSLYICIMMQQNIPFVKKRKR